ncbi:MAG: DUF2892 domain-containing protein [Elusimicrobia bacterium]|nr:DUF2892 domain-containing protein [Elusimicrobiota bacterium]
MDIERMLRGIAGFFVLMSVGLAYAHSPKWLFFTAFVGLNLLVSGFINWCPMMSFLRKINDRIKFNKN